MWKGLPAAVVVVLVAILLPFSNGTCNSSAGVCSLKLWAHKQRYYYNPMTGRCQRFVYGGCGGNANNFATLSECKKRCIQGQQEQQNVCTLRCEVGRCKARIPRYYYNSRTKQCQKFYYGGCGGNGNNFRSLSQCQRKCNAHSPTCPVAGQVFSACARPCRNTCDQLKSNVWCKAVCKPGCDCPKGQVVDKKINKCVPTRKCPTRSKPGSCPQRRRWQLVELQTSYFHCQSDYQCHGKKKCCRTRRGRNACVTPTHRRSWRRRIG